MTKLCAIHTNKVVPFLSIAMMLGLAACGGQPIKSEDAEVVEEKPLVVEKTEPAVAKAPEPVVEPEPEPVVETMPHQQAEKEKIEMEPIPEQPEVDQAATPVETEVSELAVTIETQPADPVGEVKETTSAAAGPNHFVITLGPKDPSHPAYGKGHPMGFIVDGISGKELVVERGQTYTFDISTDAKHDVYLSKKEVGWGGAPFADGVENDYIYKGTMTLKVDENTPDALYYACRNHPYMGAKIHVVNKGQKVDVRKQASASNSSAATKAAAVSESKVKQKLMFAEMMINGQGAKRVAASQNDEAKQLLATAKQKLQLGREKSQTGALHEALALANQSLKTLNEATKLVPGEEEQAELAANYKTLQAEVSDYRKSYTDNLKRMEKTGGVSEDARIDEKKLDASLAEAQAFADKKDYVHANRVMQQVQKVLTGALHKMLDSKTIVYDLKFETAKDEYEYELKRFAGYEELIPVAIEAKKPAPGAIKLMESFLSKARSRRDEAIAKAEAGDYPMAISMLLQATKTVRRALRMVGVSQ